MNVGQYVYMTHHADIVLIDAELAHHTMAVPAGYTDPQRRALLRTRVSGLSRRAPVPGTTTFAWTAPQMWVWTEFVQAGFALFVYGAMCMSLVGTGILVLELLDAIEHGPNAWMWTAVKWTLAIQLAACSIATVAMCLPPLTARMTSQRTARTIMLFSVIGVLMSILGLVIASMDDSNIDTTAALWALRGILATLTIGFVIAAVVVTTRQED